MRFRPATPSDASVLPELEQSAGLAFRADRELAWLADMGNLGAHRYREIIADGWSWVAEDERSAAVGFAAASLAGDELHLWELNVHIDHQRQGIGRALLQRLLVEAAAAAIPAMTLTTFRDLPWNAPFYKSMGFEAVNDGQLDPRLAALLAKEVRQGMPAGRRCAMRRKILL